MSRHFILNYSSYVRSFLEQESFRCKVTIKKEIEF